MTKEEKWLICKAVIDDLKERGIISSTLWYQLIIEIRKELKLPVIE